MRLHVLRTTGLLLIAGLAGCGLVDDPSPDDVQLVVDGEAGQPVRFVISRSFVAGVTEGGVTQVELIRADTLMRTLPFDTVYNIRDFQRFFVEASRDSVDLATFRMRVMVDTRQLFDEGGVLADDPYRFVYTFNQPLTQVIEVL